MQTMGEWVAANVLEEPTRAEADPELLMLFASRRVDVDRIPRRRVVGHTRHAKYRLPSGRHRTCVRTQ